MRRLRLRAVWLLILPFLWFSRPTSGLLAVGAAISVVGILIRGWAAGVILEKDRKLTTSGPYARTRNPLYLGSFFLGLGLTVAGGHWIWPFVFLVFFLSVYGLTMRGEVELLTEIFGDAYRHYADQVPLFVPRWTAYRSPEGPGRGFTLAAWKKNREYEALLGALAGFAFLGGKWIWMG